MKGLKFNLSAAGSAIGTNFGWLVLDKFLRLVTGLLVSVWVARYLGPHQFGILAYALTFIAIFQSISNVGIDNLVVRDVAAKPSKSHIYLGTAIGLRVAGATLSYLLMLAAAATFHQNDKQILLTISVAGLLLFFQVSDVVDLWFQSQLQSRRTVVAKGISYFLTAIIKITLILSGAGLTAFAFATAAEAALGLITMSIAYSLFKTAAHWRWSNAVAIDLLRQAWPLLLSGLCILLYMRIGVIFLRESAGNDAVGIYTVGASLSELWYFIPMALASSLAPYISRKRMEGSDAYQAFFFKAFAAMWALSLSVSIFNTFTATHWIHVLYGEQYKGAAEIFAIHTFTFIPVCLGVMQSVWLINEQKTKLALYQALAGAAFAVSLNFILTPSVGAVGAAISTLIAQFVQAFFVNFLLDKDLFKMQIKSLNFYSAIRS